MLGVRVADDVQAGRTVRARGLDAVPQQRLADAAPLHGWFHEQAVEIGLPISPPFQRGKTHDRAIQLGDEDHALGELFERNLHRIRIGQERFTVVGIRKRRTHLQRLERAVLEQTGCANAKGHGWKCHYEAQAPLCDLCRERKPIQFTRIRRRPAFGGTNSECETPFSVVTLSWEPTVIEVTVSNICSIDNSVRASHNPSVHGPYGCGQTAIPALRKRTPGESFISAITVTAGIAHRKRTIEWR